MSIPSSFAIVGPTASGKSALAQQLALDLGSVELVSVDAIAVYRGLDIGSDKPDAAARAAVAWHLLDVAELDEEFSASAFAALARAARSEIAGRAARAGLVGGSGLYQRALVDELAMPPRYPEVAALLEAEADASGLAPLYARLQDLDPLAAGRIEAGNRRRIVRALEVTLGSGRPFSAAGPGLERYPPSPVLQIGLAVERPELDRRIEARLDRQLAAGFLEEVRELSGRPGGLSRTVRQALGYRELLAHLDTGGDLASVRAEILRRTRRFARRQQSWFGRDPRVHWLDATAPDLRERARALLAEAGAGAGT
ncbi:MAG TPA: tRNA (adenosine(37)-N6)-dimethylallyltransferase MiaA [Acidimicrobiales bacterium]|nr:tRNA (adenosine(37)-N6)-dimethylallyltransferase MiaA [Acidimicrobiales bacterium]